MASNYSAKAMETRNKPTKIQASGGAKAVVFISMILIIPIFWYIGKRNSVIKLNQRVIQAHQSIDIALTKRANALAAVFSATKKYFKHEATVLQNVTNARAAATRQGGTGQNINEKGQSILAGISALNVVRESYPDLKANTAVIEFDKVVMETEDEISNSRRFYNSAAAKYNGLVKSFPANVPASSLKDPETGEELMTYPMFEAQDEDRKNPIKNEKGEISWD
ncbi:MAG: LemA family protein [Mycoplasma sp.]|nr:LemA family protein [Mycoplasma sp.]